MEFSQLDKENNGILTSREYISTNERVQFIQKLVNVILMPTLGVAYSLTDQKSSMDNLSVILSTLSSVHVDCDLFNVTLIDDNINTKILNETYERNKFYMLNSGPVIDKKTNEIVILLEFYKKIDTKPLDFLNDIISTKGPILGYLYIKELLSLQQRNYKNKFVLANHAKLWFLKNKPDMDYGMMCNATIAISKLAIEYHLNSILLDNIKTYNNILNYSTVDYLKDNSFIAYDEKYNYNMSQMDILDSLLEDVIIEYFDAKDYKQVQIDEIGARDNTGANDNNDDNNDIDLTEMELPSLDDDNNNNNDDNDIDIMDTELSLDDDDKNGNNNNFVDRKSVYTSNKQFSNGDMDDDFSKILKITFKSNKNKMLFMRMPTQSENDRYDRLDSEDESKVRFIDDCVNESLNKVKGSGINRIFEDIGFPIEIDLNFMDKIITSIDNKMGIIKSNRYMASWAKINIYTGHLAKLPGKIQLTECHPTIYIMFDQSGSMSDHELREINYIIQYYYKEKKYDINVFIHDGSTSIDDVKIYEFRPNSRGGGNNDNIDLESLVNSRIMCGGTSHKGVFDVMEAYIDEVTRTDKKYNVQFCLICSDLESDIDEIYKNYQWTKLINQNTYALTDSNNVLPFGTTFKVL